MKAHTVPCNWFNLHEIRLIVASFSMDSDLRFRTGAGIPAWPQTSPVPTGAHGHSVGARASPCAKPRPGAWKTQSQTPMEVQQLLPRRGGLCALAFYPDLLLLLFLFQGNSGTFGVLGVQRVPRFLLQLPGFPAAFQAAQSRPLLILNLWCFGPGVNFQTLAVSFVSPLLVHLEFFRGFFPCRTVD